jgi:hypothetical protein
MPSHAKSDATSISDLVRGIRPGRRIRGMSAILLPFKTGGAIDWAGLARQIERAAGVGLRPDPIDEFYKAPVMATPVHDLSHFVEACLAILERHALDEPGAYRRFTRDLGRNPYGCADAANILFTLGRLPRDPDVRAGWVATLQSLQDPADGLFREPTHDPIHTTAHCLAALELFDASPRHPLSGLAPLRQPDAMQRFLDQLDWATNPWLESHRGAGLYAAFHLAGEVDAGWEERYFAWIHAETDVRTGLLRRGAVAPPPEGDRLLFPALAGTFHYLFNLQHARRPLRYPEALIDTCLDIEARKLFPFSTYVGFAEIDWVYCLHRAVRQCGHRFDEAKRALRVFAARHVAFLGGLDPETDDGLDDLHALFGTLCALAELQQALPGEVRTGRPLRLVLDRRPFI